MCDKGVAGDDRRDLQPGDRGKEKDSEKEQEEQVEEGCKTEKRNRLHTKVERHYQRSALQKQ